jgi:hypothetical protein
LTEKVKKELPSKVRAALATPEKLRSPEQQDLARQAMARLAFSPRDIARELQGEDKELYDALRKKLEALEKQMLPKPQTIGFYSPATSPFAVDVIPLEGAFPLPYQPEVLKHTKPYLLIRGDVHRQGPELDAGWPAVLGQTASNTQKTRAANRTDLADWLTAPANPLTARVWANRVWQYHFGRGLVATPDDFGVRGALPTHPQLLDYLATELMESGWSTKHLHRLIVMSATYKQASLGEAANTTIDPENLYLWHWQPRRLEAEAIRDATLAVSGELRPAIGGPSIPLAGDSKKSAVPQEESETVLRRSLYVQARRSKFAPMHTLFDGPTANESCARRHNSTVPLQPLYLLNSPFIRHRAQAFASR